MDYPDATNFYDFHFAGGVPRFGDQWPDVIEEIQAAAQLSDPAERQAHYDQVSCAHQGAHAHDPGCARCSR